MNKVRIISILVVFFCMLTLFCSNADAARQKSSVLLVFNDLSGRDKGERLCEIAHDELGKKINVIYNVIPSAKYEQKFANKPYFDSRLENLENIVKDSKADYFVYVELLSFKQAEGFDLIWHSKKMTSRIGLRILDRKQNREIYKDMFSVEKKDDTDFFIVGSPSMARKSLRGALYIAGEAISSHLPL